MTNVPHSRAVQMLRSEGSVITIVASRQQKGNTTTSTTTNVATTVVATTVVATTAVATTAVATTTIATTPVVAKDVPTVQSSIIVKLNKSGSSMPKNSSQASQDNKKPQRINETLANGIKTANEKKIVDHHVEVCNYNWF